jgi:hypothetical protein
MKRTLTLLMCLLVLGCTALAQDSQDNEPIEETQETITVPKSDFEALKDRLDALEQEIRELKGEKTQSEQTEPIIITNTEAIIPEQEDIDILQEPEIALPAGGKHLALPDISLIVQAKGLLSTDTKDDRRNRLLLSEAELGIQGYVYPNVKADAFFTASPAEDEPFGVEEAYLTYLGLLKGLNFHLGKKHVAFGRTNLLHSHSWPYVNQPYVIRNLIAEESLIGQGISISYLIPTRSSLFAQLDLGTWSFGESGEPTAFEDFPLEPAIGPGANLTDRFNTARLWTSYPITSGSEIELGGSYAQGRSLPEPETQEVDYVHLSGVDLSYRHFWGSSKRLLLRGERFWRHGTLDSDDHTATGYYLFGNYRPNRYSSIGVLYDWSEFPQAVDFHESALSLILTKQFSEQYYIRLQATHGSRPDKQSFNELWLQWVWGVGPHTHNLE